MVTMKEMQYNSSPRFMLFMLFMLFMVKISFPRELAEKR